MNRTRLLLATATAGAVIAAGCSAENSGPGSVSVSNDTADRAMIEPVADGLLVLPDGVFELAGYGTVLHVDGDEVTPHYVTPTTCVIGDSFDNELPVDHATDDGIITVDLVGPTTDYQLRPLLDDLTCDSTDDDTVQAVDELFAGHYPFFTERGIDWETEISDIRTATVADRARFDEAFTSFLTRLGDGHTTLDGLDIDPDIAAFGFDGVESLEELETAIGVEFDATLDQVHGLQTDPSGTVGWGQLTPNTGYLFIGGFEGLSGEEDPVGDRDALVAAMDAAVADLDTSFDQVVIDMRFNQGGYEDLAIAAAGYFVEDPVPAYRKWAHAQPDPAPQTITVAPQGERFTGNVVVLTSPVTASAAEVFTLAVAAVADATVVGNPSFGEFSDAIDWVLPDGTELTISMEIYTNLNGRNYEAVGVPVDVVVPFDQAIDAAIGQDRTGTPND